MNPLDPQYAPEFTELDQAAADQAEWLERLRAGDFDSDEDDELGTEQGVADPDDAYDWYIENR